MSNDDLYTDEQRARDLEDDHQEFLAKESQKIIMDLAKYSQKINGMMYESAEGDAGQILKIMLLKRMTDMCYNEFVKVLSKKKIKEGEDIITTFLKKFGEVKLIRSRKEAEEFMRQGRD